MDDRGDYNSSSYRRAKKVVGQRNNFDFSDDRNEHGKAIKLISLRKLYRIAFYPVCIIYMKVYIRQHIEKCSSCCYKRK